MNLGIVLPSYLYNDTRRQLADQAFRSLAQTKPLQEKSSLLLLVRDPSDYAQYLQMLQENFLVTIRKDDGLNGTEQTLAFGTQYLLDNNGVDYVTWMGDDALFNPSWLLQLEKLVGRHPEATSWSVYRSAYEWVHRTLDDTGVDVRVRSICGHGMTFTKKEWQEWGIYWEHGAWCAPDGDTLDLYHVSQRQGERWVTKASFVEHTGKLGVHCTADIPEYARDYQVA